MTGKRPLTLFAAIGIAALTLGAADPVKVTSDTLAVDDVKHQGVFTGNVVVTRTGLTVNAERVVVEYGAGGASDIDSLVASGSVRIRTKDQLASGDKATYDPAKQLLRLTGNVVVRNSQGVVSGPELVVNLRDNTSVLSGGKGGRVTGVFTPQ